MAVAKTTSALISNMESTPRVLNASPDEYGKIRVLRGTLETAAADDAGSQYILCKLRASWSVNKIRIYHDAITNMSTADVGLYSGTVSTGLTAVSVNCYASAVDMTSANLRGTVVTSNADFAFEQRDIANITQKVYQDAGEALGTRDEYWLVITATTNDPTAAGTISFCVEVCVE